LHSDRHKKILMPNERWFQSPLNKNQLQRIDDGRIIAGINAAWAAKHPGSKTLIVQEADDDGLLWWLSDRSPRRSATPARRSPSSTLA
jgi:hypothetical protein